MKTDLQKIRNDINHLSKIAKVAKVAFTFYQQHKTWRSVESYNIPFYHPNHLISKSVLGLPINDTELAEFRLSFGYLIKPISMAIDNDGKIADALHNTIRQNGNLCRFIFLVKYVEDIDNFDKDECILGEYDSNKLIHESVHFIDDVVGLDKSTTISYDESGNDYYNNQREFRAYYFQGLYWYIGNKLTGLSQPYDWDNDFICSLNADNSELFNSIKQELSLISSEEIKLLLK